MRGLAEHFSADGELWEVVGLCHDLDIFATAEDRTRHGLLTVAWLGNRLPEAARQAIAAHDHRTGVCADTMLADMPKAADAAAVIDLNLGRAFWRELDCHSPHANLRKRLGERPYLADILERHAGRASTLCRSSGLRISWSRHRPTSSQGESAGWTRRGGEAGRKDDVSRCRPTPQGQQVPEPGAAAPAAAHRP